MLQQPLYTLVGACLMHVYPLNKFVLEWNGIEPSLIQL
jgi:hypothetical protein